MSNEIKNRQHALGIFAPVPAAPFTTPIVSEVGIDTFVRNGAGNYTIGLHDAAQFDMHVVRAALGANVLGSIGAQLAPGGATVLVTVFDALGVPFDPAYFDLTVDTVRDGEGVGPSPAFPAVPTPPAFGGGFLFGWCSVGAGIGAPILAQSSNNPVQGVVHPAVTGQYDYTLNAGMPALAAVSAISNGVTAVGASAAVVSPTAARVEIASTDVANTAYFYQQ